MTNHTIKLPNDAKNQVTIDNAETVLRDYLDFAVIGTNPQKTLNTVATRGFVSKINGHGAVWAAVAYSTNVKTSDEIHLHVLAEKDEEALADSILHKLQDRIAEFNSYPPQVKAALDTPPNDRSLADLDLLDNYFG